jgi:oligoribonuclease
MNNKQCLNLVWMDLEMTGLDVDMEYVLEIATIVTDSELNILEEGPCLAIHHSDEVLNRMDEWNRTHHAASGLVQRSRESKITVTEAERQTLEFIKKYCPPNTSPLCGNSVGQDRKFLEKYMASLSKYLHYRSIDVTTIKELVRRWFPDGPKFPKKSEAHQALTDIRESLQELIFYRKHYFVSNELTLITQKTLGMSES